MCRQHPNLMHFGAKNLCTSDYGSWPWWPNLLFLALPGSQFLTLSQKPWKYDKTFSSQGKWPWWQNSEHQRRQKKIMTKVGTPPLSLCLSFKLNVFWNICVDLTLNCFSFHCKPNLWRMVNMFCSLCTVQWVLFVSYWPTTVSPHVLELGLENLEQPWF